LRLGGELLNVGTKKTIPEMQESRSVKQRPGALLKALSLNVRAARKEAGLSLRALARMTGMSHKRISQIERATLNVTIATISKIASALNVPETDLCLPREPARGRPKNTGKDPD
jgi:ribosome-binding protein aMBF1 (putative translation factor)